MHATFVMPYSAGGVLCFARIKRAFEMNNVQRGGVTLLRPLWRAKLQFARRDRNWNLLGEARQPCLLVPNKVGRNSTARDADGELQSKPKNGVVPARINECDFKRGQCGMLCLQQRPNQTFIDLDFCGWSTSVHVGSYLFTDKKLDVGCFKVTRYPQTI